MMGNGDLYQRRCSVDKTGNVRGSPRCECEKNRLPRHVSRVCLVRQPPCKGPRSPAGVRNITAISFTCGHALATSLQRIGYAIVRAPEAVSSCQRAVDTFAASGQFRFPTDEVRDAAYPECGARYRDAFDELYTVGARCMKAISASDVGRRARLESRLEPFDAPPGETVPFVGVASGEWPFAGSFASIFNYDRGFLNPHKDRGLLTVIAGRPASAGQANAVRLWGQMPGTESSWVPFDDRVPADCVLIFAGEQLERLTGLPAMLHACRVDPNAERISMLHHGPHPSASVSGNRQSMALVLATLADVGD